MKHLEDVSLAIILIFIGYVFVQVAAVIAANGGTP